MPRRHLANFSNRTVPITLLALFISATTLMAGGNVRGGLAEVDPGLSANVTIDNIFLEADLDSDRGLSLGLELEGNRLGFGLEITRSDHDIGVLATNGEERLDLRAITTAEIYTVLLALRYRVNPQSRASFSVAAVGGGIGYIDFELPDGETADGGAPAYGIELALDLEIGQPSGWFARIGYRQLEADVDFEDIAEELNDTPFEPSIAFAQLGYRFGGQGAPSGP